MINEDAIKQSAYTSIGKRLVGEFKDGNPTGLYWSPEYTDEQVWHTYVESAGHIGGSRVFVISKETGEIVADQVIGE